MGASHVRFLAGHGALVIGTDLSVEPVEMIAANVRHAGGEAIALAHDVTDREAWCTVLDEVHDRYGRLDGLVNNAGAYRTTPLP